MLIFMLPAIIGLGIATSYEDLKEGKIRNKWVIASLIYAAFVYAAVFLNSFLSHSIDVDFFIQTLTNLTFAVLLGYGLFHFGLWSAGDGKLFIAYAWLIPISVYLIGYEPFVPSIILFLNTVLIAALVVLVRQIKKLKKHYLRAAAKTATIDLFNPKNLLITLVGLFTIQWIVQGLLSFVAIESRVLSIGLTVFLYSQIPKLGARPLSVFGVLASLRFIFDPSIYSLSFLFNFLTLVLIWKVLKSFLRGSLSELTAKMNRDRIPASDLKPGMFLCESISVQENMTHEEFENLKKEEGTEVLVVGKTAYTKRVRSLQQSGGIIVSHPDGLTQAQVEWLKDFGFSHYRVTNKIAFAPLLFLGVLITIAVRGNLIQAIIEMV